MRRIILLATAMAIALSTPALAVKKNTFTAVKPSFDDCYRLGWVRGVHVELGELPDWNAQCMAGNIPFDSGNAASSARPTYR
jgi:hypothetical protein